LELKKSLSHEGMGDHTIEETECFVSEDESESEFEGDGEYVYVPLSFLTPPGPLLPSLALYSPFPSTLNQYTTNFQMH